MEETMSKEKLNKSIDAMIDELFAEKPVEKSLDVASMASTKADEAVNKAPKAQKDEDRGAGRPKQIADVPQTDMDGKREGDYDGSIAAKQKEDEPSETDQVKTSDQTKGKQDKSNPPMMAKSISEEEYAEFVAFKKSKEEKQKEEVLKKTRDEQRDLIKSAIKEATSAISKENEELRKSLAETQELVKAMAERPQRRKSIDGIQALEKSQTEDQGPQAFSKSEMLDAAEELVMKKSMDFRDEHLIELENTGFIFDVRARNVLENYLKNKK